MGKHFLGAFAFISIALGVEIHISPKYMEWEEFNSKGERLLIEKGPILGIGIRGNKGLLRGEAELYTGSLNYDGQTQTGIPVQTDTNYTGATFSLGVRKETDSYTSLIGELLYRGEIWIRDIKSTPTATGYIERWFFDGLSLGVGISRPIRDYLHSTLELYAMGRYLWMLGDARMQANLSGVPLLRPRRGPHYELMVGLKGKSLGVELSYSFTKFNRSEPKPYQSGYVLQPESVRRLITLRVISYF